MILHRKNIWVALWLSDNASVSIDAVTATSGPVSTWIGDRLRADKSSHYITNQLAQLSLVIPLRLCAMSTSESWDAAVASAGCQLARSVCVTPMARCMRHSSWSIVHSYSLRRSAEIWSSKICIFFSFEDLKNGSWRSYRDISLWFACDTWRYINVFSFDAAHLSAIIVFIRYCQVPTNSHTDA